MRILSWRSIGKTLFSFTLPHKTIHTQLWQLALPIMLSNISLPLLGLIDTAILGHLADSRYLAAVAMGATLHMLVFWSFAFLRMGTTALIAKSLGEKTHHAEQAFNETSILQAALFLAVLISIFIVGFSSPLISLLIFLVDPVQEIIPLAQQYLAIRFNFAPVTLINYVLLGLFIAQGRTVVNLVLLVSANVLNAVLDYYFVYQLNLNSEGVAYASAISECFQLLLAILFIQQKIFNVQDFKKIRLLFKRFIALNFNLFLRTFFLLFTFSYFMSQGAQHSSALLAANTILLNLLMFMSNALDGFAIASESLVGRAFGENNKRKIKNVVIVSGQWSLLCAIIFSMVLFFFHQPIVQILTSQSDVLILLDQLKYWLIALPLAGFACYWLDGIYIGLSAGKAMRNSILFALFAIFFPLHYFFQNLTIHGLWLAFFGFLIGRAVWQLIYLPKTMRESVN